MLKWFSFTKQSELQQSGAQGKSRQRQTVMLETLIEKAYTQQL